MKVLRLWDWFQSTPPRGRRPASTRQRPRFVCVSIHAAAWEATFPTTEYIPLLDMFQSTPPRGRRPGSIIAGICFFLFQSTPPRGRRRLPFTGCRILFSFNPRLRVGGDSGSKSCRTSSSVQFQSTPPRGRRMITPIITPIRISSVSIHASAWEATQSASGAQYGRQVSIHASAWEATPGFDPVVFQPAGFNPRLRVGGDGSGGVVGVAVGCFNPRLRVGGDASATNEDGKPGVSIHASAWEATGFRDICADVFSFQSTPPRGRRRSSSGYVGEK